MSIIRNLKFVPFLFLSSLSFSSGIYNPGSGGGGGGGLPLTPGDTNYIQNTNSLQPSTTFFVSSGSVQGNLTTGKLSVGGGLLTSNNTNAMFKSGSSGALGIQASIVGGNSTMRFFDGDGTTVLGDFGFTGGTPYIWTINDQSLGNLFSVDSNKVFRYYHGANGNRYVGLRSSATIPATITFVLPQADGTNGQAMETDGNGNLSFQTVSAAGGTTVYNATATAGFPFGFSATNATMTVLGPGIAHLSVNTSSFYTAQVSPSSDVANGVLPSGVQVSSVGATVLVSSFPGTGVVAGTYGIPNITVNAQGDVTSITSGSVAVFSQPIAIGTGTQNNFTNNTTTPAAVVSFNGNLFRTTTNGTTAFVNIDTVDANGLLMNSSANVTYLNLLSNYVANVNATSPLMGGSAGSAGASLTLALSQLNLSTASIGGTLQAAQFPALTGAINTTAGSLTTTAVNIPANAVTPDSTSYIRNSPTAVAGSTANVSFAYGTSSSTLNLLTVTNTFYITSGSTLSINGVFYHPPDTKGSANNVLVTDGGANFQTLSWAATPNSAGVNTSTQVAITPQINGSTITTSEIAIGTVTITPTSTAAKIKVEVIVTFVKDAGTTVRKTTLTLRRGSNSSPTLNLNFSSATVQDSPGVANATYTMSNQGTDAPGVTTSVTYTVTAKVDAGFSSSTVVNLSAYQLAGGGIGDVVTTATQTFSGVNTFTSSTVLTNVSSMFFSGGAVFILSTGVAPVSPNEGQFISNGDLGTMGSFTQGIAGGFPRTLFASTGTYIDTNSTAISTINAVNAGGSGFGTQTLPANFFQPGLTVEAFGLGIASTTGNPTLTTQLSLGTTVMANTTPRTMGTTLANVPFKFDLFMTCQSTGATGSFLVGGEVDVSSSAVPSGWQNLFVTTTTATIYNTTVSNAVNTTFQWGTANISNTIKILQYWIRSW